MSTNPLLRRATTPATTENRYRRFNLLDNPFPNSPTIVPDSEDPRVNGEIYQESLRITEQTQFERLMIPRPGNPNERPLTLLMDFATRRGRGIGKTAFLIYQRRRIMRDLGNHLSQGAAVMVAAHVLPEPSGRTRKFWQFARAIAHALCQDNCIAWAIWRLRAMEAGLDEGVLDTINSNNIEDTLGNDKWLTQQGVDVYFGLNPAVERRLRQAGVREEVARSLAMNGATAEGWREHYCERLTEYRWRQEGTRLVFDDLVRAFGAAEITRCPLLVDDLEKVVTAQNLYERRGFVDDLRRYFVDGPLPSVHRRFYSLLLTIHPYIQELLTPHWNAAGLDRVCPISGGMAQENTVYFKPLDPAATAIPLVLEYMNYYRVTPQEHGTFTPFTREAIIAALQLTQGVPGVMLMLLHVVLEKAVEQQWDAITPEHIQNVHQSQTPIEPDNELIDRPLPAAQTDLLEG